MNIESKGKKWMETRRKGIEKKKKKKGKWKDSKMWVSVTAEFDQWKKG